MSPRALKKCGRDGCEERVTGRTYCLEHSVGWASGPKPRTSTAGHKAWRAAVLARDNGACQIHGQHCTGRATIADHIVNVAAGGAPFDLDNGQAVCARCHMAKTQREAAIGRAANQT
jgi:5-methylcytosine-specific restriction protein A